MSIQTPQDYMDAEDLSKYEYVKGSTLALSGFCAKCNEKVVEPRGNVSEFGSCVEFDYAGVCYECRTITPFRMRFYPDDKRILQQVEGKWWESKLMERTWWRSVKEWFFTQVFNKVNNLT